MAAIYSLPAKYAIVYGRNVSPIPPIWYFYLFISLDFFAILLQGAGGGVASSASNKGKDTQPGTNVIITGLMIQIVSMILFFGVCIHFIYRTCHEYSIMSGPLPYRAINDGFEPRYQYIRNRKCFGPLVYAAGTTCLIIFIRSLFRVVELGLGWDNTLMENEIYFLVLESLMTCIAVIPITIIHPGVAFGSSNITIPFFFNHKRNTEDAGHS